MPKITNTRDDILKAASSVVKNSGAAHLTIDAVAAEAKLSKGGVLYHYPNKRSLIEGMLSYLLLRLEQRLALHIAHLSGKNTFLRAMILAEQEQEEEERAMALAILAASAEDPALLQIARERVTHWVKQIEKESDTPQVSLLLFLAVEGLRFLDMLNLLPVSKSRRKQLHQELLRIAEQGLS